MKQEIKDKWVDALKKGVYKQGEGQLYNSSTDTYCCLGVLGIVCGVSKEAMDGQDFVYSTAICTTPGTSSFILAREALDKDYPLTRGNGTKDISHDLANLNDDKKYNFKMIAEYIERKVTAEP